MTASKIVPDILKEEAELFHRKNSSYGDSWRTIGRLLCQMLPEGPVLRNEDDYTRWFVFTRILDKMNRIATLSFTEQQDEVGESVMDTMQDISIYAAMYAALERDGGKQESAYRMLTESSGVRH